MREMQWRRQREQDAVVVPAHDEDETLGLGHSHGLEQHRVHDAEDSPVYADAKREHEDRRRRERGIQPGGAQRVLESWSSVYNAALLAPDVGRGRLGRRRRHHERWRRRNESGTRHHDLTGDR